MDEALGLPSGTVLLAPYNPRWADLFAAEYVRIRAAVTQRGLPLSIEHMGSTAIPGLPAKPIIDILAGWHDDAHRATLIEALEDLGYLHRGESGIPGREFFRRGDPRQYHVHLAVKGGKFWNDHIVFRDLLRLDRARADAYAKLKQDLATRFPNDRPSYIEGKADFVHEALRHARDLGMYRDREA